VPVPVSSWRTVGSRVVYANPWITVREDAVIRPDGQPGIYGVVEMRPSVGVVALTDSGQIALVGQWRYPLGKPSLEIPTGGCEDGEPPLAAARRELAEETGLAAGNWEALGTVDQGNGVTTDVAHVFLARDLAAVPGATGGDGKRGQGDEDITVAWLPFGRAVELALSGEITEAVSVAGLLRVALGERPAGAGRQALTRGASG
jgi:8-oxo-dGTP pyrophosphatase MutT (NUDIX family)